MSDASERLYFNGINGQTGAYVTPTVTWAQVAAVAQGKRLAADERDELEAVVRRARQSHYAPIAGIDPNDLSEAGWAVVFPYVAPGSEGDARQRQIRAALAPLLAHRRAQAAARHPSYYREFIGKHAYYAGERKTAFLRRLGAGPGPVDPAKVPYYLLLVATPEEIPFRVQFQLDVQHAVGRLAFDTIEEYANYAQAVVAAETGPRPRPRRAAFFATSHPGDPATELTCAQLVTPLAETMARECPAWKLETHLADAARKDRLVELIGGSEPPSVLFTATHGVAFPPGDVRQRPCQGALLCQEWEGAGSGKVPPNHYVSSEDVRGSRGSRGQVAFHFACYGAGTPRLDSYAHLFRDTGGRAEIAPRPFVAGLAQSALGHRDSGALAVIGHVDRTWAYSFAQRHGDGDAPPRRHLGVFISALKLLMNGSRVGMAMDHFHLRSAETASDLATALEDMEFGMYVDPHHLASMWLIHNDARSYIIIGDPAVRLNLSAAEQNAPSPDQLGPGLRSTELDGAELDSTELVGTESAGTKPAGTESAGTEPIGTESAGTESAGTELVGTEPIGTESAVVEPFSTKTTGTEPTGTEPTGTESTGTESTGTEPTGTKPTGTEPNGTKPTDIEPTGTEPIDTKLAGIEKSSITLAGTELSGTKPPSIESIIAQPDNIELTDTELVDPQPDDVGMTSTELPATELPGTGPSVLDQSGTDTSGAGPSGPQSSAQSSPSQTDSAPSGPARSGSTRSRLDPSGPGPSRSGPSRS